MAARVARKQLLRASNVLQQATVRQFDGGWNAIDSDLNLSSRYAKRLINLFRAPDGSQQLRFGTQLFADFSDFMQNLVHLAYYGTFLVSVDEDGVVGAARGDGSTYLLFNEAIARTQPGAPNAWGPTTHVASDQFNGELILCNGLDKPLLVQSNLYVRYLQDVATGSNVNTPIGRYVVTHGEYVVIAGDPALPSTLHISAARTSGTFVGDPNPNDAVRFDLGTRVNLTNKTITGIGSFRDKLIVTFAEAVVVMTLGIYNTDDEHVPRIDDVIPNYGAISHHTIVPLGEDMQFMDIVGVPSIQRALIIGTIAPNRESQLIDPEIQRSLAKLTLASLEDRVFAVFNRRANQIMYFVPNSDDPESTTEVRGFCYTFIKSLKVKAWSELRDWNWRCAAKSLEGRVFFGRGPRVFRYGDDQNPVHRDLVGYVECFSDDTCFTDMTGFTPVTDTDGDGDTDDDGGLPIRFDWVFPWSDLKRRGSIKNSRYIGMDVHGTGRFNFQMFIDNIFRKRDYLGETFSDGTLFSDGYGFISEWDENAYDPALQMEFLGGDRLGFGGEELQAEFGGGRISSDERLYGWPSKFKLFRFRVQGVTTASLRFISKTLFYQIGAIAR